MYIPTLSVVLLGLCLTAVQADINTSAAKRASNSFGRIGQREVPASGKEGKPSHHHHHHPQHQGGDSSGKSTGTTVDTSVTMPGDPTTSEPAQSQAPAV
jgi:hypothetical protein